MEIPFSSNSKFETVNLNCEKLKELILSCVEKGLLTDSNQTRKSQPVCYKVLVFFHFRNKVGQTSSKINKIAKSIYKTKNLVLINHTDYKETLIQKLNKINL